MATGIMAASLALAPGASSQEAGVPDGAPVEITQRTTSSTPGTPVSPDNGTSTSEGKIGGTIMDAAGAVVPNIAVLLFRQGQEVELKRTISNDNGEYGFDNLERGSYTLKTEAAMGFRAASIQRVNVAGDSPSVIPIALDVEATSMGVIVSVEYDEPIMAAAANGDADHLRELIAHGADVNHREEDRSTPLFVAVENGSIEITQMLLEFGAKVNARNKERQTPLMQLDSDATPELVRLLVSYGAKLNLIDDSGDTALIRAASSAPSEVVKSLIEAGADVNVANKQGQTALMNAADDNELESVRSLLLAGARVNVRNKDGRSAWDLATDDEVEDLLVSFGAEVDPDVVRVVDTEQDQ
jgi:hypothetical protein